MARPKLARLGSRVATASLTTIKPLQGPGGYGEGRGGRPWRRLVEQVKLRDKFTCRCCGVVTEHGECDHIVPRAQGGSDDMSNLQWLCAGPDGCHAKKTAEEIAQARGGRFST